MTPLFRYTGPLRAFVGAIGRAVTDAAAGGALVGVELGGRVRRGRGIPALYQLFADDACTGCWTTWEKAAHALSDGLTDRDPDAAAAVRAAVPDPAGLAVTVEGVTYRLVPV